MIALGSQLQPLIRVQDIGRQVSDACEEVSIKGISVNEGVIKGTVIDRVIEVSLQWLSLLMSVVLQLPFIVDSDVMVL